MAEPRKYGRARFITPAALFAGIAGVALVLIFQITLRPWAGADTGTDTHLNLSDPTPGYTRSELALLGDPELAPAGWVKSQAALDSDTPGFAGYVAYGCASCHGLDGRGTVSGPPVGGSSERRVNTLTRKGPGGMPAYDNVHLTDVDLDAIVAFIAGVEEVPEPDETLAVLSATPFPTATPPPSPTPLPSPTPAPTATPLPAGQPSPTPTLEPTPVPTPDPVRLTSARTLFIDVGCDICHGANALGDEGGPTLEDLVPDDIRDAVRLPERDPDSIYPEGMSEYLLSELSEAELDEIVFYLKNLPK